MIDVPFAPFEVRSVAFTPDGHSVVSNEFSVATPAGSGLGLSLSRYQRQAVVAARSHGEDALDA